MKNGKTLTLYTTLRGFLTGLWRNLFKEQKDLEVLKMPFVLLKKEEHSGLGVLGWHTYLQEKGLPFEGLLAQFETRKIFSQIKIESERASRDLAEIYGEPLWCIGTGMRNTHLRAIAPTVSNSKLSGNVSPGIEPWAANVFTEQSAKGTFIRKNPTLVKLLRKLKINNNETWDKILADGGSVQNISELDGITLAHDIPAKEVFKTFKEINQLELVNQAGLRQEYVDQSVSLNLAFPSEATPKCVGTGMRNTHLRAIAPTVSNSKLSGNVSPGVEPWAANVFTEQSAKGTFIRKNPTLVKLLKKHKLNTNETWNKILADGGSIQDIDALDNVTMGHSIPVKEVFKTFKEINQLELVNQAGLRQQYVDQSVSLNLAFPSEATPKWLNKVHFEAWKKGVKTLYYTRTESVLRGDIAQQAMSEDCLACDG